MAQRPMPSYLIYRDKQGAWRWNFMGPKGRIIAASAVGYQKAQGCAQAIKLLAGVDVPVLLRRAAPEQAPAPAAAKPPVDPIEARLRKQEEGVLDLAADQILH